MFNIISYMERRVASTANHLELGRRTRFVAENEHVERFDQETKGVRHIHRNDVEADTAREDQLRWRSHEMQDAREYKSTGRLKYYLVN